MARSLIILIMVFMAFGSCFLSADKADAFTVRILALNTSDFDTQILNALSGVAFTEVSPADFLTIDLSAYAVLYVGSTFLDSGVTQPSQDALNSLFERRSDIASFVESGHGLIALSEPIGENRYAWVPVPVASTYVFNFGYDIVSIVDPTHPVMQGLTDSGLSFWGSSYHNVFTDIGSFQTLAIGIDLGSLPLTIAGTFGKGKMVLTGQDADFHYVYGGVMEQVRFLQNIVNWVVPTVTVTASQSILWPPDHKMVDVKIGGSARDDISDDSVVITVTDEYGIYNMTVPGFGSTIQLEASRKGTDKDGRVYTITVVATDSAGNQSTATTQVICPHDMSK